MIAEPPLVPVNQPINVRLVRVGVPGEEEIDPPVVVEPVEKVIAEYELYVTVKFVAQTA